MAEVERVATFHPLRWEGFEQKLQRVMRWVWLTVIPLIAGVLLYIALHAMLADSLEWKQPALYGLLGVLGVFLLWRLFLLRRLNRPRSRGRRVQPLMVNPENHPRRQHHFTTRTR